MSKKKIKKVKKIPKPIEEVSPRNKTLERITLIAIIILCILFSNKAFQNDTFYTIKLGEQILKSGIDYIDHFSWHSNLVYYYPHWLYDSIIYLIYSKANLVGIYVSTIIIYIILVASIYKTNLAINNNSSLITTITLLITIALAPYMVARAQSLSYLVFILEVYCLEKLTNTSNKKYLFYLFILSTILANIHAAVFPFFIILFLPYLVEHLCAHLKILNQNLKKIDFQKITNFKLFLTSLGLCLLSGLLTPIKDMPYTYTLRIMMGNTQDYIREHAHITTSEYAPLLFMIIVAISIIIALIKSQEKLKVKDLFMLSGLLLMSIISNRHFSFLVAIGGIYLTRILETTLRKKTGIIKQALSMSLLPYICIIELIFIGSIKFYFNIQTTFTPESIYPTEPIKYLKENIDIDNMLLYNEYDFGSYLMYNDLKVFIDSRCDLYTKQFNDLKYDIFDDFINMANLYQERFDYYGITHILIYQTNPLSELLKDDLNYKLLYADDYYEIYEKIN